MIQVSTLVTAAPATAPANVAPVTPTVGGPSAFSLDLANAGTTAPVGSDDTNAASPTPGSMIERQPVAGAGNDLPPAPTPGTDPLLAWLTPPDTKPIMIAPPPLAGDAPVLAPTSPAAAVPTAGKSAPIAPHEDVRATYPVTPPAGDRDGELPPTKAAPIATIKSRLQTPTGIRQDAGIADTDTSVSIAAKPIDPLIIAADEKDRQDEQAGDEGRAADAALTPALVQGPAPVAVPAPQSPAPTAESLLSAVRSRTAPASSLQTDAVAPPGPETTAQAASLDPVRTPETGPIAQQRPLRQPSAESSPIGRPDSGVETLAVAKLVPPATPSVAAPVRTDTPSPARDNAHADGSAGPGNAAPTPRAPIIVEASPALIGVPQPAARAFAAGIAAAGRGRSDPRIGDGATPPAANLPSTTIDRIDVAAAAGTDSTPLDTRRDQWPRHLIDRIEALRDAADANDTRIRLVPAALGKIDVALRQQGDTLHVHFSADVAATRTLLAEAQPRLAELAQERGLRLGQTGVDGGANGGQTQDQRRAQPAPPVPLTPARAAPADDADTITDRRIA